jgi:hypothetical protein
MRSKINVERGEGDVDEKACDNVRGVLPSAERKVLSIRRTCQISGQKFGGIHGILMTSYV